MTPPRGPASDGQVCAGCLSTRAEVGLLNSSRSRSALSVSIAGQAPLVFQAACRIGLEGIVSKRRSAPYRSGRDPNWRKIKCPGYERRDHSVALGG